MIGFYTDNELSQSIMGVFKSRGVEVAHIKDFGLHKGKPAIFYGFLRGSGIAMRWCNYEGVPFLYVDNGYYDASYVNSDMLKDMSGKYRLVPNRYLHEYSGPFSIDYQDKCTFMLAPPTVYTAFMHDTLPEEWINKWSNLLRSKGHKVFVRTKDAKNSREVDLMACDAVLAYNSMLVVKAVEMGKAVFTTNGIFNNANLLLENKFAYYKLSDIKNYFADKQYTLRQIAEGEADCLLKSL